MPQAPAVPTPKYYSTFLRNVFRIVSDRFPLCESSFDKRLDYLSAILRTVSNIGVLTVFKDRPHIRRLIPDDLIRQPRTQRHLSIAIRKTLEAKKAGRQVIVAFRNWIPFVADPFGVGRIDNFTKPGAHQQKDAWG